MKKILVFFLIFFELAIVLSFEVHGIISDGKTNFGKWGSVNSCGYYNPAIGFRLKVDDKGGDDTALNAVNLICSDGNGVRNTPEGWYGNWKAVKRCPLGTYLIGFKMRSESYQGSGDDTAANDLIMYCSDATNNVEYELKDAGGLDYGDWGSKFVCPFNSKSPSFIVGIQGQVEDSNFVGSGDDTSMNNVNFLCSKSMFAPFTWIFSDGKTDFGDWGYQSNCKGKPATGFQLKVEGKGGDDTALNSVCLYCPDDSWIVNYPEGGYGDWKTRKYCPSGSYLVGFRMRSESHQGSGDDTAANDLIMHCENPSTKARVTLSNAGGLDYGSWGVDKWCPSGYYISGLMAQVEPPNNLLGDDTSLNNVAFMCIKI